ncbi:prolipoprotein diacylglyceryl transferase [bacterium]|nr:prolipoprotein diacylglyceryl transferase [bacterium]
MYPTLFRIGIFEIHAYGLLLALSFVIGIYWSAARAPRRGIAREHILDLAFVTVISAILGSRFLYVVTHLDEFRGRWLDVINPVQSDGTFGIGGLTMLGGVVLVLLSMILFCRIRKLNFVRVAETLAPSFAFGEGLTRIGCFLNGCCFGKACSQPWAVVFPLNSPAGAALPEAHIHPTQLYSSLFGFILMLIVLRLDRKRRPDGFIMSVFFILYGLFRIIVDFFRYYEESVQFPLFGTQFTINQAISFLMVVCGCILLFRLKGRKL